MQSNKRKGQFRRKAPQLIAIAVAVTLIAYIVFEILEDTLIEGASITSGPLIGAIITFTGNVTATVASGYWGIFGLMLLESSSLPVPSEVILPYAGYLISIGQSQLNFALTVLVATAAAIAGSLIDYYIGLKGIEALTKYRILGRTVLSMEQLEVAGRWFKKYGSWIVFLARLVPGLRTLISFPAGAAKMPLKQFIALTTAGCILWNALLIYVGYYLGANWKEVAGVSHYVIIAAIAVLVVIGVLYLNRRRNRRQQALANKKTA